MVMVAQNTKNRWAIYFKTVNFMVYAWHLNLKNVYSISFSQRGEDKDVKTFISQNVRKVAQKRGQKLSQYVSMVLFPQRRAAPALGCLPVVGMEGRCRVMAERWGSWWWWLWVYEYSEVKWSRSVVSDSLRPHGLYPTRLLPPWDSPGKSTGVGCHFLLQGIFPTQGSNPGIWV